MRLSIILFWVFYAAVATADPRAAPTSQAALAHFTRGNQLFSLREFQEAITEYKAGARLESAPVFNLALAQSYRMLDNLDVALWYYRQFLATGKPQGQVLNGVMNLINQTMTERERHYRETSAKAVPAPPTVPIPAPPPPPEPPPPPPELWYHDSWGWIFVGGGGLLTGLGTYLLVDGLHAHNAATTEPSQTRRIALQDTARSRYTFGGISAGVGLAAVTFGVIRFSVHGERLQVAVTPRQFMIAGRF